jgi:menaquinone-dependent protoporphyrinogen IX oxidase
LETTRLKSTAGAGVASLLIDEATILNPAPMAFFNIASFYVQRSDQTTTTNENRISKPLSDSEHISFIASDSKGMLKGSASYQKFKENNFSRKRWAIALASPIGKSSAIGINLRKTKDEKESNLTEYTQIILGLSHVLDESFSFGLIVIDPFNKKVTDNRGVIGLQYSYKHLLSLIFDIGGDYKEGIEETLSYKSAIQLKVFEDFYFRIGLFKDRGLLEKGNGIGIGWVQPKLSIDFAMTNKKTNREELEKLFKETSFSLSYRF